MMLMRLICRHFADRSLLVVPNGIPLFSLCPWVVSPFESPSVASRRVGVEFLVGNWPAQWDDRGPTITQTTRPDGHIGKNRNIALERYELLSLTALRVKNTVVYTIVNRLQRSRNPLTDNESAKISMPFRPTQNGPG